MIDLLDDRSPCSVQRMCHVKSKVKMFDFVASDVLPHTLRNSMFGKCYLQIFERICFAIDNPLLVDTFDCAASCKIEATFIIGWYASDFSRLLAGEDEFRSRCITTKATSYGVSGSVVS